MLLHAWIQYWDLPDPLQWAVVLWLFAFGACAGSFMNVVIWRLPQGRSVVYPGSRCPRCGHAVRSYDNIPILNWLILRGRCRDCGVAISGRYPAVETLVALLFVLVAFLEPLRDGLNLPRFPEASSYHLRGLILLWVLYAEQMLLLCTLLCAAFMAFDGHRPTEKLFAPIAILALFAPLIAPELRPEQWIETIAVSGSRLAVAAESVLSLLFAFVIAACVTPTMLVPPSVSAAKPGPDGELPPTATFAFLNPQFSIRQPFAAGSRFQQVMWEVAVCGLVFGIPPCARIVSVAAVLMLGITLLSRIWHALQRIPWTAYLIVAAVVQIGVWRWSARQEDVWAGVNGWLPVLAAIAIVLLCGVLTRLIRPALPAAGPGWNRNWPTSDVVPVAAPAAAPPLVDLPASIQAIIQSPSYKLAELDTDFLQLPELRPVRMQLELLKPEMAFLKHAIQKTIVVFGGTQILERSAAEQRLAAVRSAAAAEPDNPQLARQVARLERLLAKAPYYDAAREFARLVSTTSENREFGLVVATGGGPGIMEAANRGAHEVGAKSVGLNITLPQEQFPNPYITPELCFQFHYFALRKMHFVLRAQALVIFPGGFGTLDELFEVLTLRQVQRMQAIPVILYGRQYWSQVLNLQFLADEGVIADEHLHLIDYAESPQEAWDLICRFHKLPCGG